MNLRKQALFLGASALTLFLLFAYRQASGQHTRDAVVRIADIEIDATQLAAYKAALIEEINTSVRIEPGVLALYAVALKDNPAQIRLFEIYASADAYQSHLQTPHFRQYKAATQRMVRSLRLVETDPILLCAKNR